MGTKKKQPQSGYARLMEKYKALESGVEGIKEDNHRVYQKLDEERKERSEREQILISAIELRDSHIEYLERRFQALATARRFEQEREIREELYLAKDPMRKHKYQFALYNPNGECSKTYKTFSHKIQF